MISREILYLGCYNSHVRSQAHRIITKHSKTQNEIFTGNNQGSGLDNRKRTSHVCKLNDLIAQLHLDVNFAVQSPR